MPTSTNKEPMIQVLRVPIFFITTKLTGLKMNVNPRVREPTKPKTVKLHLRKIFLQASLKQPSKEILPSYDNEMQLCLKLDKGYFLQKVNTGKLF